MTLRRIIARKVAINRRGILWDAIDEQTGAVLAASVLRPFSAGASAILGGGADPGTLVTLRHENRPFDSFVPVRLDVAAGVVRRPQPESLRRVAEEASA